MTSTPRTPRQALADVLLGRPVEDWIAERRQHGSSWRLISRELWQATDERLDITDVTLMAWMGVSAPARRSA